MRKTNLFLDSSFDGFIAKEEEYRSWSFAWLIINIYFRYYNTFSNHNVTMIQNQFL